MNKKYLMFFILFFFTILISKPIFANLDNVRLNANLLNQDPDPAIPGEYLELRFNVFKSGNNDARNIEFYLDVEHPFYFDNSDSPDRNLSLWRGHSGDTWYQTLHYKLLVSEDAIKGDYELELKYKFNNLNIWNVQKFTIRVDEKKEPYFVLGNLITTPRKLLGGLNESKIDIEIQNIGSGDAEHVILEVELPDGFNSTYAFSNRFNLGNLDSSQSKIATIYLDIDDDVISDIYKAKLNISYKNKDSNRDNYQTKTLYLDIPIKSKPYLKIVSQEILSKDEIFPGDTVDVKLNIKNFGGKEARSVSVRVFKDSSHPFDLIENSDFIGNIDVNEKGEAILSFEVEEGALPKKYNFNIEIRSISENTVFIDDDSITLEVGEREIVRSNYLIYVLIGVIILGIVFLLAYNAGKKCVLKCEKKEVKKKK